MFWFNRLLDLYKITSDIAEKLQIFSLDTLHVARFEDIILLSHGPVEFVFHS